MMTDQFVSMIFFAWYRTALQTPLSSVLELGFSSTSPGCGAMWRSNWETFWTKLCLREVQDEWTKISVLFHELFSVVQTPLLGVLVFTKLPFSAVVLYHD